jgi:hypothetical protein
VETWFMLLSGAALIGGLSAWYLRGGTAWLVASLLPPALFLGWLLALEYLVPYHGGGASMWPVAFVIGGTAAALTSCCALLLAKLARTWLRVS